MKIKKWFTTLPFPYFLTHEENKVDISKIKISESGEVVLKIEEEQRKNDELSNNLTKAKDLIDKLLHCGFILPCYKKDAIIVEAEQFLKNS